MPIALPNLDDRRWADLVDEGRSLIPVYSPAWTDFNPSDPGITLLELFAFIAEMDIYQINRIPDRHKRKFLELIGLAPAGPKPARTVLTFTLASGEVARNIPQGTEYEFGDAKLRFRTLTPIAVAPGSLLAIQAADALYLGFTEPLPKDAALSLYVSFEAGQRSALDLRWEYFNGQGWWSSLQWCDGTCAFTRNGEVRITGPGTMRKLALKKGADPLYYIRVSTSAGQAPEVGSVLFNAVPAEQARLMSAVPVATGTGAPFQAVILPGAPVVESSLALSSLEAGIARVWERRPSLDASSPADAHFELDARTGKIAFGDGRTGRALPAGAALSATYSITAGKNGNLDAGAVALGTPGMTVKAAIAASGGADAESLPDAIARAVVEREAPARAVTLADYEALARYTPGVDLARVTARANIHPGLGCINAFGVVTVLVVPNTPGLTPRPEAALRDRILQYLNTRRMIGTRVEVAGPTYLEITVRATVKSFPGQDVARLKGAVVAALNRFFDPLTGGPGGNGWPFGRDIYLTEVLEIVAGAPGVDHVLSMDLIPAGCEPQCGNICLRPSWLVTPGPHQIEVV
jgi:hypothetical protein